jgi:hypothetical protein
VSVAERGWDPGYLTLWRGRIDSLAARARHASRDPAEESRRLQHLALVAEHGGEYADLLEHARRPLVLDLAASAAERERVRTRFQPLTSKPPTTVDLIRAAAKDLNLRAADYGQTAWNPSTRTVFWVASSTTMALDVEVAGKAFTAIDGVDRFVSATATMPDGWCDADLVYGRRDPFASECKALTAAGGVRLPASAARAARAAGTRRKSFPPYRGGRGFALTSRGDGLFSVSDRDGNVVPDLALSASGAVVEFVAAETPDRPGELTARSVLRFGDLVVGFARELAKK